MKRLKNITILLCFLSLLAFISCSAEDKTGVANNPPENDTEITDGETGSGSGGSSETGTGGGTGTSGETGGSGSGSETGGSGTGGSGSGGSGTETGGGSGTGTGGDSGSGTGTGGSGEGGSGSGSGSGSGEGGSGEVTPPSETETIEEIDAKDFPEDFKGLYADSNIESYNISVRDDNGKTRIIARLIPEDGSDGITPHTIKIEKWTKTTKGGKIIKLENKSQREDYIITFDYESETKTISGSYIVNNNEKYSSFRGTKK